MTREVYVKADDINKKLADFRMLRRIANEPYKRFRLSKKFLWISDYHEYGVVLCDKELTKLIEEYCDKRINELEEELKML